MNIHPLLLLISFSFFFSKKNSNYGKRCVCVAKSLKKRNDLRVEVFENGTTLWRTASPMWSISHNTAFTTTATRRLALGNNADLFRRRSTFGIFPFRFLTGPCGYMLAFILHGWKYMDEAQLVFLYHPICDDCDQDIRLFAFFSSAFCSTGSGQSFTRKKRQGIIFLLICLKPMIATFVLPWTS